MGRVGKIPDILRPVRNRPWFLFLPALAVGCGGVELPCNIQERDCQEALLDETAAMLGIEAGAFPSVSSITPAELRELIDRATAEVTPRPEIDAALAGFGLIPADMRLEEVDGDFSAEGIAAFYLPGVQDVVIVERESTTENTAFSNLVLAHEFVHLFQDRRFGLDHAVNSTDEDVAYRTLVEGDATLGGDRVYAAIEGVTEEVAWERTYLDWRDNIISGLNPTEWRRAQRLLVYPVGAHVFALGARPDEMFASPPRRFRAWLRGTPTEAEPPPLTCLPPIPPTGWQLHVLDELGAAAVLGLTRNLADAQSLQEDRLAIYVGPNGATAAAWHLSASSADAAERIAQATGGAREGTQVRSVWGSTDEVKALFQERSCGGEVELAALPTEVDFVGASLSRPHPLKFSVSERTW